MKKIVILLMLLVLALPQLTAAAIPGKSGHVVDQAALFPANEIQKLSQQAEKGPYAFYILTVDSLEGALPEDYASQVYKDWRLTGNDVLLLIAKEERAVEINYRNKALDAAFAALPADYDRNGNQEPPITEFINRHFIPAAQEGDFARGALATIEAADKLKSPGAKGGTASGGPSATTIAIAGAACTAFIALIIGIQAIARGRKAKNNLEAQVQRVGELMARIPRETDELKPFTGFLQGESEKLAAAAERILAEQLVLLDQLNKDTAGREIAAHKVRALRAAEQQLKQGLDEIEARINHCQQEIGRLKEADSTIKQRIGRLTELLQQCRTDLSQAVSGTGYPLSALHKTLHELEEERDALDKLRVFDPIAACEEVTDSKNDSGRLLEDVGSIRSYEEGYRKLPSDAAALRQRLDALTHEHGIQLAMSRLRPDKLIDQAQEFNEQLIIQLKDGEMRQTGQLADKCRTLLEEALAITVRQGELKRLTREQIGYIASKQLSYEQEISKILELFSAAKLKYTDNHWRELEEQFQRMILFVKEVPQRVSMAARLCEDTEQQFDAAHERLEQLLSEVRDADELTVQCRSGLSSLDMRADTAKKQAASWREQFQQSEVLIRKENIPYRPAWTELSGHIHSLHEQILRLTASGKVNLEEVEQAVQQLNQQTSTFVEEVNQAVHWKAQAANGLADAHAKYESVKRRGSNRINLSLYNKRYLELRNSSEQLFNEGNYKEAMERIAAVTAIIQSMESDYQAALAMERMAAEQRRNRSGNGGNSSGGSSWGGGNNKNSSGGSSWGDNGKNSSGGSKW